MNPASSAKRGLYIWLRWAPADRCAERSTAGVKRITVLSTIDAANDSPAAAYNRRRHLEWEDAVAASGLPFTCPRPGAFVSNALRFFLPHLKNGDVVRLPFPDSQQAPIDTWDIARMRERIPERYVELLLGQWAEEVHMPALVTTEVERTSCRAATPYSEALARTLAERNGSSAHSTK